MIFKKRRKKEGRRREEEEEEEEEKIILLPIADNKVGIDSDLARVSVTQCVILFSRLLSSFPRLCK